MQKETEMVSNTELTASGRFNKIGKLYESILIGETVTPLHSNVYAPLQYAKLMFSNSFGINTKKLAKRIRFIVIYILWGV